MKSILRVMLWIFILTVPLTSSQESLTEDDIREAFLEATEKVALRKAARAQERQITESADTPSYRHNIFQSSNALSQEMAEGQQNYETATRILQSRYDLSGEEVNGLRNVDTDSLLGDTLAHKRCKTSTEVNCNPNTKFRTFDGSCNNLENPRWGMARACFERLLEAYYADGISAQRQSVQGGPLPQPRRLSLNIHEHLNRPSEIVTHTFMQWGQFLDHDIALTPLSRASDGSFLRCCPSLENNPPECDPVQIPKNDPFYAPLDIDCLNNVRSLACATCELGPRQHPNQLTAFIDASMVYGTSIEQSNTLRRQDGTGGLLSQNSNFGPLLPPVPNPQNDSCSNQEPGLSCFLAGDQRVNQHPALVIFHTIFMREHNRIVRELRKINPGWSGERLFQEARRIVGAEIQMITYNEFVPLTVGYDAMEEHGLFVRDSGFTRYNPEVNPGLRHEFSTAAFRFGHSNINYNFPEMPNVTGLDNRLQNIFLYPFGIYRGQLDSMMRGLTRSPSQEFDRHMIPDVTNHLYKRRGTPSGLDLASLNIKRGRDHGIPPYVDMVRYCGGPDIRSFDDLKTVFVTGLPRLFSRNYRSVLDIDLFSGGLAEKPLWDAVVGPTFACIMAEQFGLLKDGDRYYFEHRGQSGSFTHDQLTELRKVLFAKIVCLNTEVQEIQPYIMEYPSRRNQLTRCNRLPTMSLLPWRARN